MSKDESSYPNEKQSGEFLTTHRTNAVLSAERGGEARRGGVQAETLGSDDCERCVGEEAEL